MSEDPKQRAYTEQAAWHGHKSRLLADAKAAIPRLEAEIAGHLAKLIELSQPELGESHEKKDQDPA